MITEISVKSKPNKLNENELSFEERKKELEELNKQEEEKRKRERKSPFSRFYQINKEHSDDMQWLLDKNPKAFKILLFLLDHMDKYNALICSYQVFQEALGISKATVQRAIALLKEENFVYVYKTGTSNVYVVNNDLAWSSWGNNTKYCEFPTNLILSASEQETQQKKVREKRLQTVKIEENQDK